MKKIFIFLYLALIVAINLMPLFSNHAGADSANLITNSSAETANATNTFLPQSWSTDKWGTNSTTFNYKNNEGHTGSKSLYVNMTSRTSGDAKWRFDKIAVKPNQKYIFSDYYKSNIATETDIEYTDTSGKVTYVWLASPKVSATSWTLSNTSFTTPANVTGLSVLHIIYKAGWLQTDDYSLNEVGTTTAPPTAPTVTITAPAANSTVAGTQAISANAADAASVAGVQFKVDGTNVGAEDTVAPYSTSWNTAGFTNGAHTITATARNSSGLTMTATETVSVQNNAATPPIVSFTSPVNGSTVSGATQQVAATASDAQGIVGVQFKLDGVNMGAEDTTSPYSTTWNTTTASNVSHTLTAVARNTSGLSTTATSTVTVNNVVTPPPTNNTNLITNPSVEIADTQNTNVPANWTSSGWGTNSTQYSYLTTGHTGSRSVKTQITSFGSGDAKWYFAPVAVSGNKSYTFTDYYQSTVSTDMVAEFTDTAGNVSYQWLGTVAANGSWTPMGFTFTTPTSAVKVTVLHVIASVGSLVVDDANLFVTPAAPASTGLIANSSLEYASVSNPSVPTDWSSNSWGTNTSKFEYMNDGHTGSHSVKVTVSNYQDGDAKWYFNPITTLTPGGQYRFSTWYKTNTIPHAVAMYTKADGTEQYYGMPNPQPNGTSNWQFYTDTFTVPLDAKSVSAFLFLPNNGYLQTDDYSLTSYTPVGFNRSLITLTFDDGYEGNVTNALPLLNQYGFKTTQCFETMDIEGVPGASNNVMSFYNSGHEICSHTVTHPFLTQLTQTQLTYELTHSQQYLQSLIGVPVRDFASPYGDYNQAVDTEIAKYYRSHRTVDEGFNSKDNFDIYRLRVQNMTPTTSLAQVQSWINQANATNTWLILVYHRIVTTSPEAYDTYQSDFAKQLQAISQSGITVKTWSSALDELTAQL